MFVTMLFTLTGMFILTHLGVIDRSKHSGIPFIMFSLVSLIMGTVFAAMISRRPLSPLREIINASDKIARGDYSVRLALKGPPEITQLSDSFNHMAQEIGSVEMLRSDFVNNFSHEFKTPIVSIRGFAKMLENYELTPEERKEYLDIIISESERLTELADNVLNLSRIEQQTIITNRKYFNVSEQIRLVIALLDSRWSEKHIDILFSSDEVFLSGNEELLRQVWINLLDNAIKFSPDYSTVEVRIVPSDENVTITFTDQGDGMTDETAAHVFDKFYQGDTSHTTKGNGLGLAIARKIVELHGGTIRIKSTNETGTIFEIVLLKNIKN